MYMLLYKYTGFMCTYYLIQGFIPMMLVYLLSYEQYGYSGHVINLLQDVPSFVNSLACQPTCLDIIAVRKEST